MKTEARVAVIIPACNEEKSIGKVIAAIPEWVDDLIVVNNGSTDRTSEVAQSSGARVVRESRRGYGSACLAGMAALEHPDVVVFLDGDFSDYPEEMGILVEPIRRGEADMVIGSRKLGQREPGALTLQQRFGNWLACRLIQSFWKVRYTDLGPFRAIRASALERLGMCDRNYGWTVEMQIRAAMQGLRIREVPVRYRRRIGKSKVSGTIGGVLAAGTKILSTIFLARLGWVDAWKGAATVKEPRSFKQNEELEGLSMGGHSNRKSQGRISVIIPTLNESSTLTTTLNNIHNTPGLEVIVADGGSRDGTESLARGCGAKVVRGSAGRARQMNSGAQAASGDILLFLHADTHLPEKFDDCIRETLSHPETVAGAFELRLNAPRVGLRVIERLANWRSKRLQMPYGDQGIFLRSSLFRAIGGFQDINIMEDFELIRRLRKHGRIEIVPVPVITSARRWVDLGIWKTTLTNQAAILAYCLGVEPSRIARWYHGRHKGPKGKEGTYCVDQTGYEQSQNVSCLGSDHAP